MTPPNSSELRNAALLSVPVETLWKVFTQKEHLEQWWGPRGMRCEISELDFREGGEWRLTLSTAEGMVFPNRSIYREILPLKKIVFEHFNPHFIATIGFESKDNATQLEWSMLFDSQELRDIVVNIHKADKGQEENLQKLAEYLESRKE